MNTTILSRRQGKISLAIAGVSTLAILMTACNRPQTSVDLSTVHVQGGLRAVATIDQLLSHNVVRGLPRKGALLGVYVAQYLSQAILHPVHAAIGGVQAQSIIIQSGSSSANGPDFELLQIFGEQLNIDVSDTLNRSIDRQQALDTYLTNLTATGKQANDRYTILLVQLKELQTQKRDADRENSTLKSDVQKAIKDKDFTLAGEKQKLQTESEKNASDLSANLLQTQNIVKSYDTLLTLFGQRTVAISKNRELLISGLKAVDIPGVDSLNIIQHEKGVTPRTTSAGGSRFSIFDFSSPLEGL
ncbi:MAG: hypothetical protein KBD00_06030 [Candidatus Peribacteraceae bacterium]|nr:hypothetical protein [Candidatus Peribacteraceae bacterium]